MRLKLFGDQDKEGTKWDAWIGEKIREARLARDWTQAQLAEAVYKSQGNISDIERGNIQIGAVDLMLIAGNLEKPITFFFPPGAVMAGPNDLNDREKELIRYIDEMSPDLFDLLMQQAKQYRDLSVTKKIEKFNRAMADQLLEAGKNPKAKRGKGKK